MSGPGLAGTAIVVERSVLTPSRSRSSGSLPAPPPVTNAREPGDGRAELLDPVRGRLCGIRPLPAAAGGRVRPVRVRRPALRPLGVVEERAAVRDLEARRLVRATGLLEEPDERRAVARGLRGDVLVGGVVVAPHGRRLGRVQLQGEREDAVLAIQPVDLVAVGDVQVGRLLRRVAVARRHAPTELHERRPVVLGHVGRDVRLRVAERPEDQLAVRVERDVLA